MSGVGLNKGLRLEWEATHLPSKRRSAQSRRHAAEERARDDNLHADIVRVVLNQRGHHIAAQAGGRMSRTKRNLIFSGSPPPSFLSGLSSLATPICMNQPWRGLAESNHACGAVRAEEDGGDGADEHADKNLFGPMAERVAPALVETIARALAHVEAGQCKE